MKKIEYGAFCELYGKTLRNLVVEHMLENQGLDLAVGDIAEELNISRPKAYEIIKKLEKERIVGKGRIVSGSQLYKLNEKDKKVKLFIKDFKECLKIIAEECGEKNSNYTTLSCGTASTKQF